VLVLLLGLAGPAWGTQRYVGAAGGSDSYDGLAPAWDGTHGPKATIQAAINTAASGDTVTVAQGSYAGQVSFGGRNLTLRSTDPTNWSVVCATTITCGGTPPTGVTFGNGETSAAVLAGFTISTGSGRGISCTGASPTLRNCRITGNSSYAGGGIYLSGSSATILNCLVYGNFTGMSGAGGIYTQSGGPTVLNSTIASNSCGTGGALAGGLGVASGTATLRNCILWGNTYNGTTNQGCVNGSATVSYSCVQNGTGGISGSVTWGSGILSSDPLFADSGSGDYHLKSAFGRWNGSAWTNDGQTSPGIDAGDPSDDYSLEPAGNGGRVNLGTFANTPEASRSSAPGPQFVTSTDALAVPEGDTAQLTLCLSQAPAADVSASLSLDTGADADLSITSSTTLVFCTTNWATPQTIVLADAEDADAADGMATLRIAATGLSDKTVALSEVDDEVTLTVAADAGGTAAPAGATVRSPGEVVAISATPGTDVEFDAWTGDTATVANPAAAQTTVTVNTDTALLATFILPFVTYYVDGTAGNNAHDGLAQTWDGTHGPKLTVQAAIDAAYNDTGNSGELVLVLPGTYAESVSFRGLDITLSSLDPADPAVVASTTLSAPSGGTAVTFGNGETAASVLTGFTVTSSSGRGISCSGASPTVTYCRVRNNSYYAGGGVYLSGSSATIRNCLVYSNFTGMSGAGGIYTQSGSPTIVNCTIAGNSAGTGGALAGGLGVASGTATVRNCILWGNTYNGTAAQGTVNGSATVSYSCVQGGTSGISGNVSWGSGILSSDPLFADSGSGDYHLKSAFGRWTGSAWTNDAQTSPGIDAGDPADSYAAESAPNGARVNLGFDGNTAFASRSESAGPEFVLTPSTVTVPEGGSNSFTVTLSEAPAAALAVTVTQASGDTDLSVSAGASFSLDATNWSTGQSVTLAAAEDNTDTQNGQALFTVQATGMTAAQVTATEADDDVTLTVTGGTPAGATVHEAGSTVTVTPAPPEHYQFVSWTGDVPAGQQTQNPLQLALTADASVTAQFGLIQHTVAATCDHGTVTGAGTYDYGTQIQLGVTPDAGYHFASWTGDVPAGHETDNPLALTVTGNLTLAAQCSANQPALVLSASSLAVPEGATAQFTVALSVCPPGAVTAAVAMAAEGDADLTIQSGATLTFTAVDWSVPQAVTVAAAEDDADVVEGTRTAVVSATGMADATVLCQESEDDVTLTVTGGTPAGATIHEAGSVVEVSATPAAHHHFTEWTGDTGALANPLAQTTQATLAADTVLAAQQAIDRHTLTLVSAHGSPQGAGEYDYGTTAEWSVASPAYGAVGERFVAGQASGQALMDQDRTVGIAWTTQYRLAATAAEHGSAVPADQWLDAGSTASATATAAMGWHFVAWSGDVPPASQTDNPVSLAMDQPRTLVAAFARNPTTYWAAVKTGSAWSANWPARTDGAWTEVASLATGGGWHSDFSVHVAAGQGGFALDALTIAERDGTAIAAAGFETGTTGQPPPGWTFDATWGDLGVVVVTEAVAAAGTKALTLAGSTADQGVLLPASAAAGDTRTSLALYLPATLPASSTLLSLWYGGVCLALRTDAAGLPELGLGGDAGAPAASLDQPLVTGAWNALTLFMQTVVDTDADGMDDVWETAAFGGLSRDGTGDCDADGSSDLLEWQCGTDPAAASLTVALVPPAQTEFGEGAGTVTCHLQISQAATTPVLVGLAFAGTATRGTDYTTTCGTEVVFSPGQTSVAIPLMVIPDAVWDPAETILLAIEAVSGACPGSPSQLTLTIREADDDGDGMDDQWEVLHFGSAAAAPGADADGDGLTNLAEFQMQSDPTEADTNDDGLGDGAAVAWGLAPAQPASLLAITSPANGKVLP